MGVQYITILEEQCSHMEESLNCEVFQLAILNKESKKSNNIKQKRWCWHGHGLERTDKSGESLFEK